MRYYWLRDRANQQQFNIYWEKGALNNADYYTKHHATKHHREIRPRYVRDKQNSINLLKNIHNLFH